MKRKSTVLLVSLLLFSSSFCHAQNLRTIGELSKKCQRGDSAACIKLKDIAINDEDYKMRSAATKFLTDQTILKKIALNDEHGFVRADAAEKITDQTVLKEILLKDNEIQLVKAEALKKINDENLINYVALNDKDRSVRIFALGFVSDQSVIKKIAYDDQDKGVCRTALVKITDQTVLRDLAVINSNNVGVLESALSKIQDIDSLLIKTILQKQPSNIIKCKLLSFEPFIKNAVQGVSINAKETEKNFPYQNVNWLKTVDYSVAISIFNKSFFSKDYLARKPGAVEAFDKGSDHKTYYGTFDFFEVCDTLLSCVPYNEIQQILLRSGFDDLRIACLERVTDQELLKKLAISDKEELMRIAANDRLKKLIGSDQR